VEHKTIRAVVSHLVSQLLAIVSLRAGPQILPASQPLLLVLLGLDLLLSVAVLATGHGVGAALLTVASSLGLGLLFCHLALQLRGLGNRFLQTATALIGSDLVITLVAAPLSLVVLQQLDSLGSEQLAPELVLGLLTVTAWLLAVVGGIFRHALDLPWPAALAVSLAYVIVTAGISL